MAWLEMEQQESMAVGSVLINQGRWADRQGRRQIKERRSGGYNGKVLLRKKKKKNEEE
jgi:hypothetical protein